jgi:fructokinase
MRNSKPAIFSIFCFGEALWDILPRGIFLGGAPLNVAYHLSRLGVRAVPVSAVGRDFLGDEALRRIAAWKLETAYIARRRREPTGTVRATLDARGVASYRITTRVAWDHIVVSAGLRRTRAPGAIVFGSLALRGASNRRAFTDLLAAWPATVRVLDLNLRAPFDRGAGLALALRHAQIVKLNDEELGRMTGKPVRTAHQIEAAARGFAHRHGLTQVCVTAGARGAGLLWGERWAWETGRPVHVRDTIGAGDAFLAAFLAAHFVRDESPPDALASACRLGEFVALRDGATPPYHCDARGRPKETT